MLDAASARIVAYMEEDGGTLCASHADEQYSPVITAYREEHRSPDSSGWDLPSVEQAAEEAAGLSAIIRYSLDEWNNEAAYQALQYEAAEVAEALAEHDSPLLVDLAVAGLELATTKTPELRQSLGRELEDAWSEAIDYLQWGFMRCDVDGEVI
jgi:hypothetical protein